LQSTSRRHAPQARRAAPSFARAGDRVSSSVSEPGTSFFRGETTVERFPHGFSEPVVVMKETREDMFEASNTYKISGTDQYLTLIEAIGPSGTSGAPGMTTPTRAPEARFGERAAAGKLSINVPAKAVMVVALEE